MESDVREVHEKQNVGKIPFQPKPKLPSNHTTNNATLTGNNPIDPIKGRPMPAANMGNKPSTGSPVKATLTDYINTTTYEVKADVSDLLDFAIVVCSCQAISIASSIITTHTR